MPLLFFTVLIDLIGFGMIIPIIPFMAPKLGASNMDIALIIAVYSVFAGILGPYWGKLSDKIGRKPVIITCLLLTCGSYVLLANAEDLAAVYVARIVAGSAAGIYGVAAAMVADLTTEANRTKSMGLIGAAFGLGMVLGPFMGGVLAGDDINFALPSYVAGGLSLLAAVFAMFLLPESLHREHRAELKEVRKQAGKLSLYSLLKKTDNRGFISMYWFHSMAITVTSYLFPLWMAAVLNWGPKEIGIVFGIQGLAMALLQGRLVGMLAHRIGNIPVLVIGVSILSSGFLLASQSTTEPYMIASFFLIITGATMCTPVLNALLSMRTPLEYRGRMMGSSSALGAWGRVIGPMVAGYILTLSDFTFAWSFGVLIGGLFIIWPIRALITGKAK